MTLVPDYYGVSKAVSRYEEEKLIEKQIELMKSFNSIPQRKN